ncbi:phosphogluconate dehydratase [Vibrio gallicus]|uniref:phosphogluconate dehydratase n=1 Tax=Vibrio gallicus TaxID=190897 RepID=UPI0021C36D76|nr:phosphogluconate dehydratase [Vibrio gallicus]
MDTIITQVTSNIAKRSMARRQAYLKRVEKQLQQGPNRSSLACSNLAHTVSVCAASKKDTVLDLTKISMGIITAYNDMLSAHQPYERYPDMIRNEMSKLGHSAMVAGAVPAMCDGVTQGQDGMDISMYSRDLIAQATAVGLSHNTFDCVALLGICDKIAPGQIMGALSFGHLPACFLPSGPMPTGISNEEKVKIRQQHVAGEVDDKALLNMECGAYHSPGTCTFFGTANTNQLVFEAMGLMLPGSAFVPVTSELRHQLNLLAIQNMVAVSGSSASSRPLAKVVDEKAIVNSLVALIASGGSTNHTIHMIAVARAAGFIVTWDDFDALSNVVPQLAKVYPNGPADINCFQQAGGVPTLMKMLADRDLIHMDATPIYGTMQDYLSIPQLDDGDVIFQPVINSNDPEVIAPNGCEFNIRGGLKVLSGNLGRGVMKVSAVAKENQVITAPAVVFDSQYDVTRAYENGELYKDSVVVVRHNGPAANGMPELHKLMPVLGNVMKRGFKTALLTDGRLSGASGKVPALIHLTPEAEHGGPISKIQDGDIITINGLTGEVSVDADLDCRKQSNVDQTDLHYGSGRELFNIFRRNISSAEMGATILD